MGADDVDLLQIFRKWNVHTCKRTNRAALLLN